MASLLVARGISKKSVVILTLVIGIITTFLNQQTQQKSPNQTQSKRRRLSATTTTTLLLNSQTDTTNHRRLLHTRAFPSWKSKHPDESWCVRREPHPKAPKGLIFVKNYKTGSSTVSGLAKRIARLHGDDGQDHDAEADDESGGGVTCEAYWRHNPAWEYRNREPQSFLFGSVRHPTKRAISHVFFEFVSRLGGTASDSFMIDRLKFVTEPFPIKWALRKDGAWKTQKWASFQSSYMSLRDPEDLFVDLKDEEEINEWEKDIVKEIIDEYDLMMVSERMDESLVVLQILLGLDSGDLLYLKSKVGGSQWLYDNQQNKCVKLEKTTLSEKVVDYLASEEWEKRISGDLLLYTAASRSLDATIAKIGRKKFKKAYDEYQLVLEYAQGVCGASAVWPCTANGTYQEEFELDCEAGDQGCGLRCLDNLTRTGVWADII
mmetsp:Transcript_40787/g.49669  ORF Transcript_40787/g.49669 Transcript_40787/m.49669 type:complete len:434 (+) Transcript_40787:172-1473(+)|eukprot:CAMPEP_0172497548 /NCGR_PEP_ID=MMETSP1066-20121228/101411_1 /TAXON_ID=671091 /ORGANISM="Coscinodiscus wailesii, Strain CCMP2513" /LENGTH=433 /DNA_ID=CAMNT_0013270389 /DNA_START=135 /DNA_END=1436 /DNA_ORIENTATION=+